MFKLFFLSFYLNYNLNNLAFVPIDPPLRWCSYLSWCVFPQKLGRHKSMNLMGMNCHYWWKNFIGWTKKSLNNWPSLWHSASLHYDFSSSSWLSQACIPLGGVGYMNSILFCLKFMLKDLMIFLQWLLVTEHIPQMFYLHLSVCLLYCSIIW